MIIERSILVKALVGSHNYNLATPESDKDYKIFTMPTFDDLYRGKMYSKADVGLEFDFDVHDIRKMVALFWKANINFLEVLYSKENHIYDKNIKEIYNLRKDIVRMNLPYLYNACRGMHFEKMKRLDNPTEGTAHLIEKYGYNTKEALHAYRVLDFITRFAYTDFEDFEWAMTYDENLRERMLEIKNGEYPKVTFQMLIRQKMSQFEKFDQAYYSQKPNEELKQHIDLIIYNMIKENFQGTKESTLGGNEDAQTITQ
ncbi:DNA polymerase beta superfamily protein [Paenibacillus sp. Mc5Re-14]|uniref:DNA polymerase beta superfamily protein n=1 Tax=Paenibacillus sp. Mc5Re-14 TaxID=1030529 RepID=UPI000AFABE01|nr:nucleotidyltransferase domain-containing protein [Paenibacillus sp. Mc5Re-14]